MGAAILESRDAAAISFLRMPPSAFDTILGLIGDRIRKEDTNFRKAIPPDVRLALATRFLYIEVGHHGSESDGGIFARSKIQQVIVSGEQGLPSPTAVGEEGELPYYLASLQELKTRNLLPQSRPMKNHKTMEWLTSLQMMKESEASAAAYCPPGTADEEDWEGRTTDGTWRRDADSKNAGLRGIPRRGYNSAKYVPFYL
ncbi:hypothetical protein HPB47_007478, partial [Ixodes persulcatus]